MEVKKQRKLYIDALRGLAMLIVVYGHCLLSKITSDYVYYFVFTSPWNVSLFFVLSGYLFSPRGGDIKAFSNYIILRLIVPWIILGLFPYTHIFETLPLLLSGETLWFMPALIIAEIVFFFIFKFTHNDEQKVIAIGLVVSVIGQLLYKYNLLNYAMINRALTIQWLFVFGLILRRNEKILIAKVNKFWLPLTILYVGLGIIFIIIYPGVFYDIHDNSYYFFPLTCGIIVLGVLLAFYLFSRVKNIPKWLVLVGQNTLMIYILHG